MVEGTYDLHTFLQNGYWPNSRARSPDSRFFDSPRSSHTSYTTDPTAPRKLPFNSIRIPHHPPPPSVEDETESLAKEHGSVVSAVPSEEPPHRGDPDQYPILQEVHEYNPERRFVLVSNPSDASSSDESSASETKREKKQQQPQQPQQPQHQQQQRRPRSRERRPEPEPTSYRANTGRKYSVSTSRTDESEKKRETRPTRDRERRRSRLEDLPTIVTDVGAEPRSPDFKRAKSTTRVDSRADDYFSPRLHTRFQNESTLSPDVIEHATNGRDRAYYGGGSSPNVQRRDRSAHPSEQYGRNQANDRKYKESNLKSSQTSEPISPTFQKRHTADFPKQTRQASKEGLEKPRQYSEKPPAVLERTRSYALRGRSEKDPASPSVSSSRDKRGSPPYDDAFYSSDDEHRSKTNHHRRRKSAMPGEKTTCYLATPTESKPVDRRRSRGPSPLPSPRLSQDSGYDRHSTASSPRSATFPKEPKGPREEERPTRPLTRAVTARSILTAAAPIAIPAVVSAATAAATNAGTPFESPRAAIPPPPRAGSRPDSRSSTSPPSSSPPRQQAWQPPKFEPERNGVNVDKPTTSYRRYSQEVHAGELPDIPHCPRTNEESGHMDWLTLPRCDNFNICPTCYQANFMNTEFAHRFVPAPFRPRDRPLACDFGTSEYYTIAWLFTRKYKKPDLGLFHSIANVGARNQPCAGKKETVRIWYSVKDPRTQRPVQGFNVCHNCAKTVEVLLPNLTGLFGPMDSPAEPTRGVCAMNQQGYYQRFIRYFDAMESASDRALVSQTAPDVQAVADRIRELTSTPRCSGAQPVRGGCWYTMRSIPDLTVCRACFAEVVLPRIEAARDTGPSSSVAVDFLHRPQRLPLAACQLYSDRMRDVFARAVRRQDLAYLDGKVRGRRAKEQELHAKIVGLDRQVLGSAWVEAEVEILMREWKRWE